MRFTSIKSIAVAFFLIAGWLASVPSVIGQGRLVSEADLKPYANLNFRYRNDLLTGQLPGGLGDQQKKEISLMAKYYVYYMTIPERQQDGMVEKRRTHFAESNLYQILNPKYKQNNKELRKLYAQELAKCFRTVFAKDALGRPKQDLTSCIHAGLLLRLAVKIDDPDLWPKGQTPPILKMLIDLIEDHGKPAHAFGSTAAGLGGTPVGQHALLTSSLLAPGRNYGKYDIVKLFAFQALQAYFERLPLTLNPFASEKERADLADKLRPIADYILHPPMHLRSQGEIDAFRYIRHEAVKALATVTFPMLPEAPHPTKRTIGKVLVPVAYVHMHVLAGTADGMYPPPTMAEKCDAALGLCRIDGDARVEETLPSRYNEDLAVALLGDFAIEFLQEFQKDLSILAVNKTLSPKIPWRMYSHKLKEAFEKAPENFTKDSKARRNMSDLAAAAIPLFDEIRLNYNLKSNISQVINTAKAIPRPNPSVYAKTSYEIKLQ